MVRRNSPDESRKVYDAIVVGSGMSGGWAAKELTERGLDTLLLERGRPVNHPTEYLFDVLRGLGGPKEGPAVDARAEADYSVQRHCAEFREDTRKFFIKDSDYPYLFDSDKPFYWIQGNQLGGRSLTWANQAYRMGDVDFESNLRNGTGIDWPIRYADLEPWYDHVERFIGVSGQPEGLSQVPDGIFQPPMEMNAVEKAVKAAVEGKYPERRVTIGRSSILTEAKGMRRKCVHRNACAEGCMRGSCFSAVSSTIPAALATGRLTLRTGSEVDTVLFDKEKGRAAGVTVVDPETGNRTEILARIVFLCASALSTTRILLNSTCSRFPDGLGNSSGVLGHYLMDHHLDAGATGEMPGFEDFVDDPGRPNCIVVPRYRNLNGSDPGANYIGGYWHQGKAWRPGIRPPFPRTNRLKDLVRPMKPGPWQVRLGSCGECLPYEANKVTLEKDKTDKAGNPLLRVDCEFRENELNMRRDMAATAAEMLEASGLKNVAEFDDETPPGIAVHEMGTARMGRDPATSVLNAHNQMHDVPNVFITDGACMTSSGSVHPSLTYMALTARAAAYAADALKRRDL